METIKDKLKCDRDQRKTEQNQPRPKTKKTKHTKTDVCVLVKKLTRNYQTDETLW